MSTEQITRANLANHATISVHAEYDPDRCSYPDDQQSAAWIQAALECGNMWAWCTVTVRATLDDDHGISVLGGCSYESRKAFEEDNLAQMTSEALDDLWSQIDRRTPTGRARALSASARQAITTVYRGPTDSHGSRVIAKCEAKRITVPWDHALDSADNHAAAALHLMDVLGWSERNDLAMGGTSAGYVFVQVPRKRPRHASVAVDTRRRAHGTV
jgi:hypothetical protein